MDSLGSVVDHHFTGPNYTIGIEEELMILDPKTLDLVDAIEQLVDGSDLDRIKPELHECVLEIATQPCADVPAAGTELRALRREVCQRADALGLTIASAGTHPFALWEQHRISAGQRYRDLIDALRFVARQEVIFGLHVHVGIDDPDKAIHVANGMRVHVPILLALSANSPYWRSDATGLASTRVPIFRQFPRIGIPPRYDGWADYEQRIEFMIAAGAIKDYTYLWFDVRPHPQLGTIEIRAMDAQTRVEHTLGLTALIQAMVAELAQHYEDGGRLADYPHEMLEEDKWLAARHGMDGDLVDLPSIERVSARTLARRLYDRLRDRAQDLGAADELEGILDILEGGNGAARQRIVYEANHDFQELVRDLVAATCEEPR
jgi:glutamate---cysteine ligase / carboxylate-amine ligase